MPAGIDWRSNREVIGMLATCTAFNGNLLLNIGPKPDGSVPAEATERLTAIGKWTQRHGEALYGKVTSAYGVQNECWLPFSGIHPAWSFKDGGRTAFLWSKQWFGDPEVAIGGIRTKVKRITNLTTGKVLPFTQVRERLILRGLPKTCPDKVAGVTIFKFECAGKFRQELGGGCVLLPKDKRIW
jgi:alpha-L-fucosidase